MSQSKLYTQKYRNEWESNPEFNGWLKPFIGDDTREYCLYCKADFYAKPTVDNVFSVQINIVIQHWKDLPLTKCLCFPVPTGAHTQTSRCMDILCQCDPSASVQLWRLQHIEPMDWQVSNSSSMIQYCVKHWICKCINIFTLCPLFAMF
jgi:hypothetical protein